MFLSKSRGSELFCIAILLYDIINHHPTIILSHFQFTIPLLMNISDTLTMYLSVLFMRFVALCKYQLPLSLERLFKAAEQVLLF